MTDQATPAPAPLTGIRVLELGNFIAAPFAAKVFADFGAEVIKIERPGTGDELRSWRTPEGVTSMLFRTVARNKKSVTLDLKTDHGRDLALELAGKCDVVIENFRPGTIEKWGLGPAELTAVNPDLVLVRISGYGQSGPYRDRPGFGSVAESVGGLRFVTGEPDRPAARAAASVGDTVSGLYAVIGALMILLRKARQPGHVPPGGVEVVDVALYESVFSILESVVADYDAFDVIRQRTGGALPGVVPTGSYPCADGQDVVIGANSDGLFKRMLIAMGEPEMAADPAYQGGAARTRHEATLNKLITAWTGERPLADVVDILEKAGVPVAPVYDARGIVEDPQFAARGLHRPFTVPVADGATRSVRFPGVVPLLPASPGEVRDAGPEVGQHTEEILAELLGRTPEQRTELEALGVI